MDWLATWTPLKRMEEAEYEKILTGKIDAINDQMSSLDERLEKMRQEKEALLKPDS
jgi:chaperonin cofactor prefoldin